MLNNENYRLVIFPEIGFHHCLRNAEKYSLKVNKKIAIFKNSENVYLYRELEYCFPQNLFNITFVVIPSFVKKPL